MPVQCAKGSKIFHCFITPAVPRTSNKAFSSWADPTIRSTLKTELNEYLLCLKNIIRMRYYKRKTNRGQVPIEIMHLAASEVIQKNSPLRTAARKHGLTHSTLRRFIMKIKSGEEPTVGYKATLLFTKTQEEEILTHLVQYSKVFCGLTSAEVRKLSCQLAMQWHYKIPNRWIQSGTASRDWADKFVERHKFPLKPFKEGNDDSMKKFYNILHKLMEKYKFQPLRMYYHADVSITLATKSEKTKQSYEPKTLSMEIATNALGKSIPPIFIVQKDKFNLKELSSVAYFENGSGEMDHVELYACLNHFITHTKPSCTDPVLLLLDYHDYIDVNILEKARTNNIILITFPKGEKIQALENFVKLFKTSCRSAMLEQQRSGVDADNNMIDIISKRMPSESDLVNFFQMVGVWPFNPSVVTGEEFLPETVPEYDFKDVKQDVQPGPSQIQKPRWKQKTHVSIEEKDPLGLMNENTNQCRFCGDFSEDCITVRHKPYVTNNKTEIAFNDINVSLDFNDDSLPKTVCSACDAKLQQMHDFVKAVKSAQDALINISVKEEEFEIHETEYEETEDDDDNKDGIVDSITVGETEFTKQIKTRKRKSNVELKSKKTKTNADVKKPKKSVTKVPVESENEWIENVIINIKEEAIDSDDEYNTGDYFLTGDTNAHVALNDLVSNLENSKGNS